MASSFLVETSLFAPVAAGDPAVAIPPLPLKITGSYTPKQHTELSISAAGSVDVDLGSMGPSGSDIKVLLVYQRRKTGAEPLTVTFNAASAGALTVAPGGFILWANDTAQGCPAVTVAATAAAEVVVIALGLWIPPRKTCSLLQ